MYSFNRFNNEKQAASCKLNRPGNPVQNKRNLNRNGGKKPAAAGRTGRWQDCFNVEDDPASKTETAIGILSKAPFVTVDGEDNIKVNGKANFKVLLNGKETSMFTNIKYFAADRELLWEDTWLYYHLKRPQFCPYQ